jgi:exonuclease III
LKGKEKQIQKKLGIKKGIKLATLNIKGQASSNRKSKYKNLTTLLRKNQIAVMTIQETKLKALDEIKLMEEDPKIYIENNPNGATNASTGVAFVLNKDLLKNKKWKHTIIIEGRVSKLQIDWTEDQRLDIITVYFPNETSEKLAFIKKLQQELTKIDDWSSPILMGDFNFVKEMLDRHLVRDNDNWLRQEMQKLKKKYKLVDRW